MAKYCNKCGKELNGKSCDCEIIQNEVPVNEEVNVESKINSINYINAFIETIGKMFTKPVTTMKTFINKQNILLGLMTLGIHSLILSIFICLAIKERSTAVPFSILNIVYSDFSLLKLFIQTLFSLILLQGIFAGLLYLITDKICKIKTSYFKMITLLGSISMVTIVTNLISIICIYISFQIMILVLFIGFFLSLFYLYQGFGFTAKLDDNKKGYILVSALAILILINLYGMPFLLN